MSDRHRGEWPNAILKPTRGKHAANDGRIGTIGIDGTTRPRSASGTLSIVNSGDTLVLTSSQSALINIPSFQFFIQDHCGGLRRLGPFNAELYHR